MFGKSCCTLNFTASVNFKGKIQRHMFDLKNQTHHDYFNE